MISFGELAYILIDDNMILVDSHIVSFSYQGINFSCAWATLSSSNRPHGIHGREDKSLQIAPHRSLLLNRLLVDNTEQMVWS